MFSRGFGQAETAEHKWSDDGLRLELAPLTSDQTRAFFRRQMYLMGIAHMGLAIYAIQLAILANFEAQPRLHPSIFWVLMIYFVFLGCWLLYFFLHFRRP